MIYYVNIMIPPPTGKDSECSAKQRLGSEVNKPPSGKMKSQIGIVKCYRGWGGHSSLSLVSIRPEGPGSFATKRRYVH